MKTSILLLLSAVVIVLGRPNLPDDETLLLQARLTTFRLSGALESFTKKTYYLLSKNSPDENLVYSPFSIHAAASMLFYGSPGNSSTFEQLSNLLGLNRREHYGEYLLNYLLVLMGYERDLPNYVLAANRIYVDQSVELEENFRGALARFYRADAIKGDFALNGPTVAEEMNEFVSNTTRGNIKNIISPRDIDELTRLVIINAIYFKGDWLEQFDPLDTLPGQFRLSPQSSVLYPKMMNKVGHYWVSYDDPELNADIIDLPYENQDFSMLLFIPNDPNDYSLNILDEKINNYQGSLFDNLYRRMVNRKVNITMPSFEIETSEDISEIFIALGVTDVFDQSKSNLNDISTNYKDLHVDYIKHKARIIVNEEGTEASAATAIVIGTRSSSSLIRMSADRPFIFIITDKRFNIPLFFGKYVNPSKASNGNNDQFENPINPPPARVPQHRRKDNNNDYDSNNSKNDREETTKEVPQIFFPFRPRETLVMKKEHILDN